LLNKKDPLFSAVEKEGGSKENTHNHWTLSSYDGGRLTVNMYMTRSRIITSQNYLTNTNSYIGQIGGTREDSTYDEKINIMNPYKICYKYKRTG